MCQYAELLDDNTLTHCSCNVSLLTLRGISIFRLARMPRTFMHLLDPIPSEVHGSVLRVLTAGGMLVGSRQVRRQGQLRPASTRAKMWCRSALGDDILLLLHICEVDCPNLFLQFFHAVLSKVRLINIQLVMGHSSKATHMCGSCNMNGPVIHELRQQLLRNGGGCTHNAMQIYKLFHILPCNPTGPK